MTLSRGSQLLYLVSCAFAFESCLSAGAAPTRPAVTGPLNGPFFVQSYIGKCLTYGTLPAAAPGPPLASGSPVTISDCVGTASSRVVPQRVLQQIFVEEINESHEVVLHAGGKVIGIAGGFLAAQAPLELQDYQPLSSAQTFQLDGDSIILARDRNLVVEVRNGRGANGTPLVLGNRDLDDTEFWTFASADRVDRKPTRGFIRVPQDASFGAAVTGAKWGDVVEVDPTYQAAYPDLEPINVGPGVTIRGNRRFTLLGPEISAPNTTSQPDPMGMLVIGGNDVRITGMRLRGPTRDKDATGLAANGIHRPNCDLEAHPGCDWRGLIIDHNDLSDWTVAGVNIDGSNGSRDCSVTGHPDPVTRQLDVRVVRNFIHDQRNNEGSGYGIVVGSGGFASIVGNTFLQNRHSIAGDGTALAGYSAWFNLVLSRATRYGCCYQQDFDMHGSRGGYGPPGGSDVEVGRNTFLGTNRDTLWLRGAPCGADRFSQNIVQRDMDSIEWYDSGGAHNGPQFPIWLDVTGDNVFGSGDPTQRLGVADFDGDGKDDLFLATGTAWYFAPAGAAEWRYLSAKTEGIDDLLFGDFDGDGRADVFTKRGPDWLVSWGGLSPWERINRSDGDLKDFAIGDFDGDHRADVFYADGTRWRVSYGGVGAWVPYAVSSYRVQDLRFGDFDGDGKTDVFGVVAGDWMVVYGGTDTWAPLRHPALTTTVAGLVVADFDGDRRADVATTVLSGPFSYWEISHDGQGDWTFLRFADQALNQTAAVGRFDDLAGADVLIWDNTSLAICSSASGTPHLHSRQDMR